VGKYGTNLEGFGAFEGGVNADKGAPLISTSSDGGTALIFGPAASRTITAGVENGDFAIPPDAAGDTVTDENPLPYWTFTDNSSAGAITCAIVADAGSGSGNILRWTVAANTSTKAASIFRYVPIAATRDRAFSYSLEVTAGGATSASNRQVVVEFRYYTADLTTTGSAVSRTMNFNEFINTSTAYITANTERLNAPADAAYARIYIEIAATTTNASLCVIDLYEIRMLTGQPMILITERDQPSTYGPGAIWKADGNTNFDTAMPTGISGTTLGKLYITPTDVYITSPLISSDAVTGIDARIVQTESLIVDGTSAAKNQITIPDTTAGAGLTIGGDTNLYRSAANTLKTDDSLAVGGTLIGAGVTTDLKHGITLQRTTNLTVNTSVDASATAITWSSAVKNTSLYAYWSSGSTIAIPLTGWYSITCHLISGTGLGTGFAFRLYALVNGTVIAETETQAGANTTSDTFSISTIAYMTAADSLVFRASASSASKTIGGSRRSACSVVYLGNTSA
jgi:hypothetical protein